MEEKCKKCTSKADYICVCIERHLCDKCLLNHVSNSSGLSHRPVSLTHPLLTLLMEPDAPQSLPSSNTIRDQILKLTSFKEKSINMIDKKIKLLLDQNEKNSLRRSVNKTNDTNSLFKVSSGRNSRISPAPDGRSQINKSPELRRGDLSPEPTHNLLSERSFRINPESHYKIIITGDPRVGKTTLMTTFKASNNNLSQSCNEKATGTVKVDNNTYHLDLWDLSSKDRFSALNKLCVNRAVAAVILFDLVDEVTLWSIEQRLQEFSNDANVLSVVAMVGNKLDLTVKFPKKRHISYEKAHQIATSRGMIYDEISANNPQHVTELFKRIAKEIFRRRVSAE